MSLIMTVYVNEGIVIASDRRVTYNQTIEGPEINTSFLGVHVSDNNDKTFICPNKCGIATCGAADFLGKPIAGFIKDMIRQKISEKTDIEEMTDIIKAYFDSLGSRPDSIFVIAGYDKKGNQVIIRFTLKNDIVERIDTTQQGATWNGETLTLTRLITPVAIPVGEKFEMLPQEEIAFNFFTLQDAVDFARYGVETTIKTMRFKNVVETVGGEVDILVITPDETYWLAKQSLK
ncbi:MAG: hypothetical protein IKK28_15325 [Mogibacterium sp.]|nr:hypothetical protein [Mogibacterium sp.]